MPSSSWSKSPDRMGSCGALPRRVATLALAAGALLAIGCRVGAAGRQSTGGPLPPADRLIARYRAAHEADDLHALAALVVRDGADEGARERVLDQFERVRGLEIRDVQFVPLTGDTGFDPGRYRSNLEPVGWLAASFVTPPEDSRAFHAIFVVGERDGEYRIAVAELDSE